MAEALHYELLGFDEEILKVEEQLREQEKLQRLREQRAATQQRLWLIDSKLAALLVGVDGFSPEGVPLILGHVGLGHLWRAAAVCQYLSRVAKELEKEWEVLKISGSLDRFDTPQDYVSLPAGVAGEAFGIVVEFHSHGDQPALVMVDGRGRRCGTSGPAGAAPGCLRAAGAVYHGNELFVADRNNHRVQKLKLDGTPLAEAAMSSYPSHLCMAAGELYVSAGGQEYVTMLSSIRPPPRIVVLDPRTLHENRIIGVGAVKDPQGVAVHGDWCFVADRDRIVVLSATKGHLVRVIGEPVDRDIYPGRPGQLREPGGISIVGEHLLVGCLMQYLDIPDDIDDWSEDDEDDEDEIATEYNTALQVLTLDGAPRQFLRLSGSRVDAGPPGSVRIAGSQVFVCSGLSFVHMCELI